MKPVRKIASELLGFDRRERRATYILAVILGFMLMLRIFIPWKKAGGDIIIIPRPETITQPAGNGSDEGSLFLFDPNTATAETLINLGFSERQASTLVNYRKAGARFRKPSDIYRVYGIDSVIGARLVPWIGISPMASGDVSERRVRKGGDMAETKMPDAGPGFPGTVEKGPRELGPAPVIDLNNCSAADLEQLPGIGEVLSVRILKYRDLLGGYVSASQLGEVYGLDSSVFRMISGMLKVSPGDVRIIHLDTCSWGQMARHPYLGPEAARAIMKYRSLLGSTFTVDDLVHQKVISSEQAARIAPYVTAPAKGSDN